MNPSTEHQRQLEYYTRTAATYESDHVHATHEHAVAVKYIAQLARVVGAQTVLDVGAGTGRGLRELSQLRPDLDTAGIEPVAALRAQASLQGTTLLEADGRKLPFADGAFDIVMATGVLHHVRDPQEVVGEMLRVARLGVFISDANRFGQGRPVLRAAKLALHATRTWNTYMHLRTRGRGYLESEGDGIYYSYSVFDSMPMVSAWADRAFVIPTQGSARGRLGSLLDASHGLLVGLREP